MAPSAKLCLAGKNSGVAAVLVAMPLVGVVLYLSLARHRRRSPDDEEDVLVSFLNKTAPVAAAEVLASSETMTCVRKMNGSAVVITKDPKVAHYIFNGRASANYVRWPASVEGLRRLGMHNQGLIWNNDVATWTQIRGCFKKALTHANIEKAASSIRGQAKDLLFEGSLDMMSVCRRFTFRATLSTFFGIDACDYASKGINEEKFIDAIVDYFKAWEFFLLRPEEAFTNQELVEKHSLSVDELRSHVKKMLSSIDFAEASSRQSNLFAHELFTVCQQLQEQHGTDFLVQSSLEMMLAGTDTSSVTAYYALLGLAGDKKMQSDLRQDIAATKDASKSKVMRSAVDETLRFKPVGPVVLREAVNADQKFPECPIEKGTVILIHLAEMNLCEDLWPDAKSFCPMRFFKHRDTESKFFPFGNGPKGCIGMHLGRREVVTILETVVMNYEMEICGEGSLADLETHWDIANQPSADDLSLIQLTKIQSISSAGTSRHMVHICPIAEALRCSPPLR